MQSIVITLLEYYSFSSIIKWFFVVVFFFGKGKRRTCPFSVLEFKVVVAQFESDWRCAPLVVINFLFVVLSA